MSENSTDLPTRFFEVDAEEAAAAAEVEKQAAAPAPRAGMRHNRFKIVLLLCCVKKPL